LYLVNLVDDVRLCEIEEVIVTPQTLRMVLELLTYNMERYVWWSTPCAALHCFQCIL